MAAPKKIGSSAPKPFAANLSASPRTVGKLPTGEGHVDAGGVTSRKSMKPGGGGRFEAFVQRLAAQGKSESSARAIAAQAGRAKYGAAKMAKWSAAGRKRGIS